MGKGKNQSKKEGGKCWQKGGVKANYNKKRKGKRTRITLKLPWKESTGIPAYFFTKGLTEKTGGGRKKKRGRDVEVDRNLQYTWTRASRGLRSS